MHRTPIFGALAALAVLATTAPPAHAGDADGAAVAVADGSVYVGGSVYSSGDLRSSVIGRWNPQAGSFDWLERVEGAAGGADGITDVVHAGGYLYGVGYGNGALVVSKLDPRTGTLQRSCGGSGVVADELGASILPGRAAALGDDLVVVGGTLALPTRGVIAIVDGRDCSVKSSAFLGAADPSASVGFTTVSVGPDGFPIAAGFAGSDAALFRFGPDLTPLATRTFDLGGTLGEAFTGLGNGVAVAPVGATLTGQCFTLPALEADTACGPAGRRSLSFGDGTPAGAVTLTRLASGSWLAAGSQLGYAAPAGFLARAALAALAPSTLAPDPTVFGPSGALVLNPFPYQPSAFAAVTAHADGVTGIGSAGYAGSRVPFLFSAAPDGGGATVTPLDGFESARAAPVQPAPETPPAPAGSPPAAATPTPAPRPVRAPLASARFVSMFAHPDARGGFGSIVLRCTRACTVSGGYLVKVRGHSLRIGAASARLRAGNTVRLRLALSASGLRRLQRARRLPVTVRFRARATKNDQTWFQTRLTLHRPV